MNHFTDEQLKEVAAIDKWLLVDYLVTTAFDQNKVSLALDIAKQCAAEELERRERRAKIWTDDKWDLYPGMLEKYELLRCQLSNRFKFNDIRKEIDQICRECFGGQFFDLPEPFRCMIDYINGA